MTSKVGKYFMTSQHYLVSLYITDICLLEELCSGRGGDYALKGMVFAPFWSETGIDFANFWSGIGYGFRGNYRSVWTYLSFRFQIRKKEREICKLEMDWRILFLRSKLIIFAQRPGLKTGMENDIFWSEMGSGFGDRAAHSHREFLGVPSGGFASYG